MKKKLKSIRKIFKREYFRKEIMLSLLVVVTLLGFVVYESLAIFSSSVSKESVARLTTGSITFNITSPDSDYNSSTKRITIAANTTKFFTLLVENTTPINVKYQMYYKMISPSSIPSGLTLGISNNSINGVTNTLTSSTNSSGKTKAIRIGIKNNSTSSATIEIGADGGYSHNSTVTLASGHTTLGSITEDTYVTNYAYVGEYQKYVVPESGKYKLETWGAEGGYRGNQTYSGKGGYSYGTLQLTQGTTLYVYVGGQGNSTSKGWNGGGTAGYSGVYGGGATDIRTYGNADPLNSTGLNRRIIVAGGGGSVGAATKKGGAGGGTTGVTTTDSYTGQGCSSTICGQGGTQSSGGAGTTTSGYTATSGSFGKGGTGYSLSSGYGGAGGGGWYGGSGSVPDGSGDDDRGGGGGSGYVLTSSSTKPSGYFNDSNYYLSDAQTVAGSTSFKSPTGAYETGHTGDGYVRISKLDSSGANQPVLPTGLVPVVYNEDTDNWQVADKTGRWYDYDKQMWANAVTVNDATYRSASIGTDIPMSAIDTMWVWIPRYKYMITSNIGSTSNVTSPPEIDVVFETGTDTTGTEFATREEYYNYYTHPAFRSMNSVFITDLVNGEGKAIGWDSELSGIWVGKFETGVATDSTCGSSPSSSNCSLSNVTKPLIKPDVISLNYQNISTEFQTSLKFAGGTMTESTGAVSYGTNQYGITRNSTTDSHMMKNTEWGAVAYLSQSKYGKNGNSNYTGTNKEIYKNNSYASNKTYTGRSSGVPPASGYSQYGTYGYNDKSCSSTSSGVCTGSKVANTGTGASTTGTIYGIYDMVGGMSEYTMSNWAGTVGSSGFNSAVLTSTTSTVKRYYDKYTGTSSNTATSDKSIKGDATYETERWYSDNANFVYASYPWANRGGYYDNSASAGAFYFYYNIGTANNRISFRSALIP